MNINRLESIQRGKGTENHFQRYFEDKGWKVTAASQHANMYSHLDFKLEKDGEVHTVDVKSEKKVNRSDTETQNELIFLEWNNVQGRDGWLLGKATVIAFQDGDNYLMIPREKLVERATELCKDGKQVTKSGDALYNFYTRAGRHDLISLIKKSDIIDLHLTEL